YVPFPFPIKKVGNGNGNGLSRESAHALEPAVRRDFLGLSFFGRVVKILPLATDTGGRTAPDFLRSAPSAAVGSTGGWGGDVDGSWFHDTGLSASGNECRSRWG